MKVALTWFCWKTDSSSCRVSSSSGWAVALDPPRWCITCMVVCLLLQETGTHLSISSDIGKLSYGIATSSIWGCPVAFLTKSVGIIPHFWDSHFFPYFQVTLCPVQKLRGHPHKEQYEYTFSSEVTSKQRNTIAFCVPPFLRCQSPAEPHPASGLPSPHP